MHPFPLSFFGSFWSSGVSPVFPESFLRSLGNRVTKAESYVPALCFQRSKCDCQVYKRLFMFSGVKWGAGARSRARESGPARADSPAFILHATADKALLPPDRGHKSPLGDAVPTAYPIPHDKHTIIHPAQHFFSALSIRLAGARAMTRGSEEPAEPGTLPRGRRARAARSPVPGDSVGVASSARHPVPLPRRLLDVKVGTCCLEKEAVEGGGAKRCRHPGPPLLGEWEGKRSVWVDNP